MATKTVLLNGTQEGSRYNEEGPATVYTGCTKYWYQGKLAPRVDGPASN